FYKKSDTRNSKGQAEFLALNLKTLEYGQDPKMDLPSLALSKQIDDPEKRIKALYQANDDGGKLIRRHLASLFAYASHRIPEISDQFTNIDDALKAGFAWSYGPFEYWDLIGVKQGISDAEAEGLTVAFWVHEMLDQGIDHFYLVQEGKRLAYDPSLKSHQPVAGIENKIELNTLRGKTPVYKNDEATLHDIGDGVLCFEFRSKANVIGEGILRGIQDSIRIAEESGWKGMVIGNQSTNFSVGANLMLIAMMAYQEEWDDLDRAVRLFQETSMRCRYSAIPVVAATQGYVFGGGCEFSMHCDGMAAAAESYIGLVEAGVGLIPGGGGTKEMALRMSDAMKTGEVQIPQLIERCKNMAT
ncbi:MAG TPA: enoyl-CoA hydratase/isomerase family protein, partial [Saprospiraceae bacterium]|nr:enoyl-CoA hydratase/isomerase family protein [Saprospiraceae bacterium]